MKRWIMRVIVILIILAVPFAALGGFDNIRKPPDAISAATEQTDDGEISGSYLVFINGNLHKENQTIDVWKEFFEGGDIPIVLEDISCFVCNNDSVGMEYAKRCQSKLPKNQMKIQTEDSLLLMSKAENEKFDIFIISKELADRYDAKSIEKGNIIAVTIERG